MTPSLGSPTVQMVLLGLAALFLLWELWSGWRRGVVRSAIHFFAFVFSGVIGLLAGQATAMVVGKIFPGYGAVIGLVVGSFLTLFVLALALLLGALLFKRTEQQPGGLFRILFGAGGAFFGLLTGLFILWGGISIVRAFGAIAKSGLADQPAAEAPTVARELVRLKDSLELGPAGRLVESIDIVPPETYDLITRAIRLSRDPDAMMRFIDYPGVQAIMQHPTMAALVEDPQVIAAAERRDVFAIMQSPKVLRAATDPELSKLLMSLDLQKALDYALPPAQSSPTPASQP